MKNGCGHDTDAYYDIYRFNLTLGNIYKSPLRNPQTVLDLGTGTGIWAMDMAE